jgi:hypothetical protein
MWTVAMASVVAFITPIGHHGNVLVYGPGGYRFADFARVGTPPDDRRRARGHPPRTADLARMT